MNMMAAKVCMQIHWVADHEEIHNLRHENVYIWYSLVVTSLHNWLSSKQEVMVSSLLPSTVPRDLQIVLALSVLSVLNPWSPGTSRLDCSGVLTRCLSAGVCVCESVCVMQLLLSYSLLYFRGVVIAMAIQTQ